MPLSKAEIEVITKQICDLLRISQIDPTDPQQLLTDIKALLQPADCSYSMEEVRTIIQGNGSMDSPMRLSIKFNYVAIFSTFYTLGGGTVQFCHGRHLTFHESVTIHNLIINAGPKFAAAVAAKIGPIEQFIVTPSSSPDSSANPSPLPSPVLNAMANAIIAQPERTPTPYPFRPISPEIDAIAPGSLTAVAAAPIESPPGSPNKLFRLMQKKKLRA